jgi:hypothetical protein
MTHLKEFLNLFKSKVKKYKSLISVIIGIFFLFTIIGLLFNLKLKNDQLTKIVGEHLILNQKYREVEEDLHNRKYIEERDANNRPSPLRCRDAGDQSIWTKDKKFYTDFDDRKSYKVCITAKKEELNELTGQSQYRNIVLIGYSKSEASGSGSLMFIVDTQTKTMKYIKYDEISGLNYKPVIVPPRPYEGSLWSPNGQNVLIRTMPCWGCDPGPKAGKSFIYNLQKNIFTKMDDVFSFDSWVDNNTVKWTEVTVRDITEAEIKLDPYAYPFVTVRGQSHTTQVPQ